MRTRAQHIAEEEGMEPRKIRRSSADDAKSAVAPPKRKRISRNEIPKYMWNFNPQPQTSKHNTKKADAKESPMCVASMAELFLPSDLQLNSPKRAQENISLPPPPKLHDIAAPEPSNSESENDKGRAERLAALMQLQGVELMRALQQAHADEFVTYKHGYLNPQVAGDMSALYAHVLGQGDVENGPIYGSDSPFCRTTELPQWYPEFDEDSGLTRQQRLTLAHDFDVWQWYTIAMEDFSVLDTLVWMGVQMHKLFQDTY